jgi:hypothetical protein
MGNNNSTQIVQLNLSQNLIPKDILNQYNQLIVEDITSNIGNDVANLPNTIITPSQINTVITQMDLYSQVVNSISTITAQNVLKSDFNTIITNAMNDKTKLELIDFNNEVKSIQPNINEDIQVVTNQNFINLISNIVQNTLDVTSLKKCLISHTTGIVDINTNNQNLDVQTIVQKAISNCTDIINQISIITNNIVNTLDIKITLKNTIKTPQEYLAQFQSEYNVLQEQYNVYNTEITGPQFSIYNDDKEQIHKLHEITRKMEKIAAKQEQIEKKIVILQEQPYFSPQILAMLEGKEIPKNMLDVSGNQSLNYKFKFDQERVQNVNKTQTTKQNDTLNNTLNVDKNISSISKSNLTVNRERDKTVDKDKEGQFFGDVPKGVRIFIFICCGIILLISSSIGLFYAWRARRAVSLISKAKDLSGAIQNDN